jgi:hypothetical protein
MAIDQQNETGQNNIRQNDAQQNNIKHNETH